MPEPAITGGAFRTLKNRNFSLFFWGQLVSLIGTWSQLLAVSWLIWRLTESAMWLGIANFAVHVPCILLGLPAGFVADRYDRLTILTVMQALCMLQALALAWLTLTGAVQLWHVIVFGFFLGSVYAFEIPIRQAFVTDLVGKRDLLNAVALVAAMFHLTRMLGPTVAGGIVAWKGEGICFLFNAVTFLALIGALLLIRRREMMSVSHTHERMFRSIKEGLIEARRKPSVLNSLMLVAALAGIGMQYTTLLPVFADKIFGGGAVELGWMMGASGAGSLISAMLLARRRSSGGLLALALKSALIFSIVLIVLGLVHNFYVALAIFAVMGFTLTLSFSCINTLLQHATSDHMRGRMMSLYSITFMGLFPFGSLAAGGMAKAFGVQLTVMAAGLICLIAGGAIWIRTRKLISA